MADIDRHLLESPAATAPTTSSVEDDDDGDEGFTFASVPRLAAGRELFPDDRIAPVYYPVFGRPRPPPPPLQEEEDDPSSATVRMPLGQLLLEEERGSDSLPLDGVPAETYCLWSPGARSPAATGYQSPSRCQMCGTVLRWRQRLLGRSHGDGKDKFVFLNTSFERNADGSHHGRDASDGSGGSRRSFLPYKKDLVGPLANAGAFRRSYHPF